MEKCTGATVAQKEKVRKTTQRGKKIKMVTTLTSLTPGGTVGTETLQQVRDYAMAARSSSSSTSASQPPPRKKVKKTVPTHQSKTDSVGLKHSPEKPTFTKKLQGGCYLLVLLDLLMWNEGPRG